MSLSCFKNKRTIEFLLPFFLLPGGVLLSQDPAVQVPSTLESLTSVFGMGTGVTSPSLPPDQLHFVKFRFRGCEVSWSGEFPLHFPSMPSTFFVLSFSGIPGSRFPRNLVASGLVPGAFGAVPSKLHNIRYIHSMLQSFSLRNSMNFCYLASVSALATHKREFLSSKHLLLKPSFSVRSSITVAAARCIRKVLSQQRTSNCKTCLDQALDLLVSVS